MVRSRSHRAFFVVAFTFFTILRLDAQVVDTVRDRGTVAKLRSAKAGETVRIHGIPTGGGSFGELELTPARVWADDAKVVIYGANGIERIEGAPDTRYFRGRLSGVENSGVSVALHGDGTVTGVVFNGDQRIRIATGRPAAGRGSRDRSPFDAPILVSEMTEFEDLNAESASWSCGVDTDSPFSMRLEQPRETGRFTPRTDAGYVAGAGYEFELAFDTDNELYAAFGSIGAVTTYIGNLVAAANIIYERDLNTTLLVGHVNVRSGGSGSDPWTVLPASGTTAALLQFGTYWHNNHPFTPVGGKVDVQRATAVFVSGKIFNGGVAWVNVLGADDFAYGADWGGGYAFLGSAGSVTTSVPDPTLTVDSVLYGMGHASTVDFWMLAQFAHELGHNANGPHTHCVALSPAQQSTYGVPGRGYIDLCEGGEGGCYSGAESAPSEKGTIMSYCHNQWNAGGWRQSRYIFGVAGQPNELIYDYLLDGLEAGTPNPTITSQAPPLACSSGRTASVASIAGYTYSWSIAGGTINTGAATSSITYTPAAANVTLTVTVTNPTKGAAVTASKTIATSCSSLLAPTNVQALKSSGSNVLVSWSGSNGATSYSVWRSTGGAFVQIGVPDPPAATSFLDTTAAANAGYTYKVKAHAAGNESPFSGTDVALTMTFTDPVLSSGMAIRAAHLTELRTAAANLHALAGLTLAPWTDATITAGSTTLKAAHFAEVQTALRNASTTLGLSMPGALSITSGGAIPASHITTLRTYGQ